jgi:hypothetical protein
MIVVIDDFITDENLLKEIANDKSFFQDPGHYYYWKGWWNGEANTTKKKLIEYIWRYNCPINKLYTIDGFEYWTGVQEADPNGRFRNYLEMHYDDDVQYRKDTGNRMSPTIGCVYYPIGSDFTGGALNIYTNGEEIQPEVILCKQNRLIIFDAGYIPHRVDTVLTGTRRAIAINLWDREPYSYQKSLFKIE